MSPTSPAMRSHPTPYLLLLLLSFGLQAPQARGAPVMTPTAAQQYNMIKEMQQIIYQSLGHPRHLNNPEEKSILWEKELLRPNLETFLNAANRFSCDIVSPIKTNLKEFRSLLPTPTPTANAATNSMESPINIQDWNDFLRKLNVYLQVLHQYLENAGKH